MKNILFLVTGMTPQIITETVWALACDSERQEQWIADEIHILTTAHGANLIRSRLLEKGVFEQFKQDYPILKNIQFDTHSISIVENNHEQLNDLKTPLDNEITADLICQKVREFTQNDDVCLHVSIAGGRKTMGFYAGYALSLYGRLQDKMSHILVESDFENVPDFYYPTPYEKEIITDKGARLNAKNAKVWLAEIPFVRLRSSLGKNAVVTDKTFSEVVDLLNVNLQNLQVNIDIKKRKIQIGEMICQLTPKEMAIYLLAIQLLNENDVLYYPSKDIPNDNIGEQHQKIFNNIYGKYKAKDDVLVDFSYLSTALSTMNKKFVENFGNDIANQIKIQSLSQGYGLILEKNQIKIA